MTKKESKLIEIFKNEIAKIQTPGLQEHLKNILNLCPDYISECPSSSTGKYHPADEINPQGMTYHVKRCCIFAEEIGRMDDLSPLSIDILLMGCILHDVCKSGIPRGKYTVKEHPIYVYKIIQDYLPKVSGEMISNFLTTMDIKTGIETGNKVTLVSVLNSVANVCLFHEGRWTIPESKDTWKVTNKSAMSKEDIQLCKYMHMADFFASRRTVYEVMQTNEHSI